MERRRRRSVLVAALAAAALAVAGCSDQQAGSLDMAPPSSTSAGGDIAIDAAPCRCLAAWPTAQELDGLADANTAPPELRAGATCDDSHNRLSPAP